MQRTDVNLSAAFLIDVPSSIIHHPSYIFHHTSYIIHHPSYIFHHTSYIIHHTSYILHHTSSIFFIPPPRNRRMRNMTPRNVSSMAIAVQTPGSP